MQPASVSLRTQHGLRFLHAHLVPTPAASATGAMITSIAKEPPLPTAAAFRDLIEAEVATFAEVDKGGQPALREWTFRRPIQRARIASPQR